MAAAIAADKTSGLTTELGLELYRGMVQIRSFEKRIRSLAAAGVVPGLIHLYAGEEAMAVAVAAALGPQDAIISHHRGHGHCLARGSDSRRLTAEILEREPGYGLGRGGSMHIYDAVTTISAPTVSSSACRWRPGGLDRQDA